MAEQHLQFSIGSTFSGEGFKQAQQTVGELNGAVTKGAGYVGQLSSAMGGLDGTVGKAARALSGMLAALTSGNPILLGVTAAVSALTWAYSKLKEQQEEAKKEAEEFIRTQSAFNEQLNTKFVTEATSRMASLAKEFERITKHANDLTAAMSSLDSARAQGGIIALQAEKVAAVMAEVSDEARNLTAAEYDLKIATAKAAAARQASQAELDKAHQAVVDEENRIANLAEQRAAVLNSISTLEKSLENAKRNNLTSYESGVKKLETLRSKLAEIDEKTATTREHIQVLLVQEQTAAEKYNNAVASAEIEVTAATGKIADLKQKAEDAAAATADLATQETELASLKEEEAARLAQEKELRQEAAKVQQDVNDAAKDLADAERAYAAALAAYNANFEDNKMSEGVFNGKSRSGRMAIPVRIDGAIKAEVVAKSLEDAINNGLVKSVKDMDKFAKERARELDQAEKEKWRQLAVEKQKYDQLMEKRQSTLSQRDKDFMQKFETLRDAAEAQKNAVEEAKQRVEEAKQRDQDNHDNLQAIADKIKNLGLQ